MPDEQAPALKEWFNADRFRDMAAELGELYPRFDRKRFLELALPGLDSLTLLQRLRRMTECFRETLPADYRKALRILEKLAPRIKHGFVTLVLPDFVACYGLEDFDASMEALEYFTSFGSSEFAIRHFLRRDLRRTLAVMEKWSRDKNEHTRRLASEGSRPRLPWSFRLEALIADPTPVVPILENLNADPSLYVRKSVANHLNDITKDHPAWVMDRLESWPLDEPHTRWIAKRALRTLIKAGDRRALHLMGAGGRAEVRIAQFAIAPRSVTLGESITLSAEIESASSQAQRLVIDYAVHYVKKSGGTSAKVFKWKETVLGPGSRLSLARSQSIRNFTTRVHYPGRHRVELMINGDRVAKSSFVLASADAK